MGTAIKQQNKVPELRFPGFDGSWHETTLGKAAIFHDGKRVPLKQADREKRDGSYRYYGASGVIDYIDDYIFDGEYVLLGEDGANIVDRSSRLAFLVKGKFWVNNHAHVIEAKGSAYFLAEFLESLKYDKYNTGTAQPKLNSAVCKTIPVILPDIAEQQKIADFLGSVDDWLDNLRQQKTALETYKRGMMQKLFTQQVRFKDESGKDFPVWEDRTINNILKIGSGRDYKHLSAGEVPVYGTGGYMCSVNKTLYSGETVCIGRKGTINKPFYHSGDLWTVDTLFYTYDFIGVTAKFVNILFQQINWLKYNEASGVPSLSKTTIEKIPVRIPSLMEQQKIADFLTSIDKSIESKQQQIAKAEEWKKGLMQKMFV